MPKPKLILGHIPYNSMSEDMGFVEVMRPGCFQRWLDDGQDLICRVEHDSRLLLARRSSGGLRIWTDTAGLHYEVDIPSTTCGQDTFELCAAGVIFQSSFAFVPYDGDGENWLVLPNGELLRELLHVALYDLSPVSVGAYKSATIVTRTSSVRAAPGAPWLAQLEIDRLRQQLAAE